MFQVYLPHWLEGGKSGGAKSLADNGGAPRGNPEVQIAMLNGHRRLLRRLREKLRPRGVWVEYRDDNSYNTSDEKQKQEFISSFAASVKPGRIVDLGANTGVYSRLVAAQGCPVISLEEDHDALDVFYRELARENSTGIELARVNLASPTPGIG